MILTIYFLFHSSLGCKAIFLLGGKSRNDKPLAMFLRSGDIVLMSGEARERFHGQYINHLCSFSSYFFVLLGLVCFFKKILLIPLKSWSVRPFYIPNRSRPKSRSNPVDFENNLKSIQTLKNTILLIQISDFSTTSYKSEVK